MHRVASDGDELVEDVLDERDWEAMVWVGEAEGVEGDVGGKVFLDEIEVAIRANGFVDLDEVGMRRELSEESWFSDESRGDQRMVRM